MYHGWLWCNTKFSFHSTLNRTCISGYRNRAYISEQLKAEKEPLGYAKHTKKNTPKTYSLYKNLTAQKFVASRRARAKLVKCNIKMLGELERAGKGVRRL